MQANPSKFQFMFLKHFRCKVDVPDSIEIDSSTITRQSDIKLLGMTIYDKLNLTSMSTYSVRVLQDSLMSCIGLKIYSTLKKKKIYTIPLY